MADYYIHNIDPVIVHIYGNIGIRYYGLAYALGFVFAFVMMRLMYKHGKLTLTKDQQSNTLFILILGVLIGGRLGHMLLYDLHDTIINPLSIIQIWKGGMASHGGFIGVIIAGWWISKKYKLHFLRLLDLLAVMTPFGLMLGRIANFINGELWGKVTEVPWAVIFPQSAPPGTPTSMIPPRHPSQLYEAALEGLLLLIYSQWRMWKTRALDYPGRLSGEFLLIYAVVRIFAEQFKEPETSLIFGLHRGVFYSLFFFLGGIALVWYSHYMPKKQSVEQK